jgi:enamine deaminase RidA (YjgF/YER057c/UK114 family)
MFGFGFSRLFRSRWAALLWAAGVLYTAYSIGSDPPAGGDPAHQDTQQAQAQLQEQAIDGALE